MARKKHAEHENHERWLVSYADFITLLFAFFVVMYAISSINEGKYRVLSEAMVAAFRSPPKSLDPIQVGQVARSPYHVPMPLQKTPIAVELAQQPGEKSASIDAKRDAVARAAQLDVEDFGAAEEAISNMADAIEKAMTPLIDQGMVAVRRNRLWIEVEIKSSILFPSGSATLSRDALPIIEDLAEILQPFDNRIHVEGFTDNLPINTVAFPSNWELSAARAASVVHLLTRYKVDPRRMAAIGFSEYRPVASNGTAEGRAKNRRVALVILAAKRQRTERGTDRPEVFRDEFDLFSPSVAADPLAAAPAQPLPSATDTNVAVPEGGRP